MLSEISDVQTGLILLAGVIILVFFSLRISRRARQHAAATNKQMHDQFSSMREHSALRGSMDQLLIQLEEYSRKCNAQIDTKCAKIETVVRDADQRIARLEALLDKVKQIKSVQPPEAAEPVTEKTPSTLDNRVQRIYALVDSGLTPIKIAEEIGVSLGEVELALNLRNFG